MKTRLPLYCLLFLLSKPLSAQIVDRSLNFGFLAYPQVVRTIGPDKWLVVGKSMAYPGGLDTLFALIYDQDERIVLKKVLAVSNGESYDISCALTLPDGAFIVAFNSGDCDSPGHTGFLKKFSPEGQLLWFMQGDFDSAFRPPFVWELGPDGNLLGFDYNQVWKVDVATGLVLWQARVIGLNGDDPFIDYTLLPGTENLLSLGADDFQVWEKTNNPAQPDYYLQNALPFSGYRQGLGWAMNGWYYFLNTPDKQLERINTNLDHEVFSAAGSMEGVTQMISTTDALYFLGRQNGQNWLRKTDFLGQNPVELPMPDRWLNGYSLAIHGDSIAVVGTDGSGSKSNPDDQYPVFQARQLWLRTFSGPAPTFSKDTINAAITGLQQLSGVDTASRSKLYGPRSFALHGGDFQVQISNHGNTVLERVYVNFSYEENQVAICYSTPALQRLYTGLNLAPGASAWVNFGDLDLAAQSGLAAEFCFWTAAPNGQPDARHEDDFYCQPAIYTNANPVTSFQLSPNPASGFFSAQNPAKPENAEWRLYDATGHSIQQGIFPAGQTEITVSTELMPNGFYFFRMNYLVGKLVIRH